MKWFDRMTVFRKLLLAFAVVIGFCVVIGGTSLKTLSSMHDITNAIGDRHMNGLYWIPILPQRISATPPMMPAVKS
jgi:hypothetical protein